MANSKRKSIFGEIGSFLGLSFAGISVGIMAALALHLIGLGRSLIPGWVGYTCIPLWAVALYVAVAKGDWRGLAAGLVLLVPALFSLGMADVVGARELSSDSAESFAYLLTEMMGLVAIGCPLAAGLMAIILPLLLPRENFEEKPGAAAVQDGQ